jgi:hypothetical protein
MSVDEMRLRARRFQMKARFAAVSGITMGLFACITFAWTFTRVHEVLPRVGFGLLSAWGIYVAYQAYKWIWPRSPAPNAAIGTSLEFYRSELERRRDWNRHVWRRSGLTFCFLGLAMAVVPELIKSFGNPSLLPNSVPFFALLTIWFVAFFYGKKRRQNRLQQEIDELRTFER